MSATSSGSRPPVNRLGISDRKIGTKSARPSLTARAYVAANEQRAVAQVPGHARVDVRRRPIGVQVDELHVLQFGRARDQRIEQHARRRRRAVEVDLVPGVDGGDRLRGTHDPHEVSLTISPEKVGVLHDGGSMAGSAVGPCRMGDQSCTITARNAPGITDGVAATVVASELAVRAAWPDAAHADRRVPRSPTVSRSVRWPASASLRALERLVGDAKLTARPTDEPGDLIRHGARRRPNPSGSSTSSGQTSPRKPWPSRHPVTCSMRGGPNDSLPSIRARGTALTTRVSPTRSWRRGPTGSCKSPWSRRPCRPVPRA